ncbi:uncharacterized protein LOC136094545 [Hydra vulgaris]|uniref:uncharacterized protein LOC136094545 n=1 Tax=Hydra vulgaris TaxID=6087 RepID=UPI0032EA5FA8
MDKKNIVVRKKSNETGNIDETQIPTNVVRDIFHEMFLKQQKDIFKHISEKTNKDIEESLTVTQDIQEKKLCELEKKIKNKNIIGEEEKNNYDIPKNDQETWDETEKKLLILFKNKLNISNVDIERAHRVGNKEENKTRTIVVKIQHYKDKIKVLNSSHRLKGTGIYINEDFSFETTVIRKKLLVEMKMHRKNGKYSSIKYDKLIVREFRKIKASA